jgi:hypothetical protein
MNKTDFNTSQNELQENNRTAVQTACKTVQQKLPTTNCHQDSKN